MAGRLKISTPERKRLREFQTREQAANTISERARIRRQRLQFEQRIRGEKVTGPRRKRRGF
jgi:hypothetical protein